MRIPFILLTLLWLHGCGTVTTLSNSDQQISSRLSRHDTYCDSVSRVYSGVAYDFCRVNSKPSNTSLDFLFGLYLIDGVLSAVTDTLVLPYTIYAQSEKGSIQVAH